MVDRIARGGDFASNLRGYSEFLEKEATGT
jgi:hypothetical protein